MLKRKFYNGLLLILLIIFISLICTSCSEQVIESKKEMCSKVKEHQSELEELVVYLKTLDKEITITKAERDPDDSWKNYLDFDNQLLPQMFEEFGIRILDTDEESVDTQKNVTFSCERSYGYWGFYYVENDQYIGWSGSKMYYPTEKEGKGYSSVSGSVYYYTEKITDHWYYFEAED
jgi:hypothetical protein